MYYLARNGFLLGRAKMRRWLVAVLLCILVLSAVFAYLIRTTQPPPPSTPSPTPTASPLAAPEIGIFYYVWYDAPNSDNWNASKFVDYPVYPLLGNYSSLNSTVILQQLVLMKNLGIDFVVISWWGFGDAYENFTDNAAKQVFQVAEDSMINLKFAIMVEPFIQQNDSSYDYNGIYNHIYNEFVVPYPSVYYNYSSKPLICFYNDPKYVPGLTPNGTVPPDKRFNTTLVGQQNYTQWTYNDLDRYDKPSNVPHANEISVTPRYDDSRLNRTQSCVVDANLTKGIYDQEWKNAIQLWEDRKIDTIMITSWNEYKERTEIEPHYDGTANNTNPYFLYNETKYYINQIQQLAAASYLKSHFNETVGLIYESEDKGIQNTSGTNYSHDQIYYIYSDNLLAEWALKPYEPQISNEIYNRIQSYNIPPSNFFEVLFGNAISTNMSTADTLVIKQNPDSIILAEFHNSSSPLQWDQYGDTLIYQSLNSYLRGNRTEADDYFYEAYNMWGGKGINDHATQTDSTYANYKLALILYASKVLNLTIGNYTQIEEKLWSMQQPNGGITSLADLNGNPIGSANAETTAMALLPYNNELVSQMQSLFGSCKNAGMPETITFKVANVPEPSPTTLATVSGLSVAIAVVGLIYYYKKRNR